MKIDSSSELEPKVESNLLMESSNELNLGVEKIFFQSKLVDYLGSENMILHIGSANTINRKITKKCNGFSCGGGGLIDC